MKAEIIRDPKYGYLRIEPIPTQEELSKYYREEYFKSVEKGGRAQEIMRQQKGGEEAELELEWLSKTLYKDILDGLGMYIGRPRLLLDVGSGTGAFLKCAKDSEWLVVGIEPSQDGNKMSKSSGLLLYNMTLDDYIKKHNKAEFDAITLLNVLEHVPNPIAILEMVKNLLKPCGVVCIRVPNDFSIFQECAEKKLGKSQWWVTMPDHINYFNFESLQKLLEGVGFEVLYKITDFPMELFLLMGEDYVGNPDIGNECHKKRRNFEMSIPDEVRRNIYSRLATIGVGRSCIMFARVKGTME